MRVLVTGGNRYIGLDLVFELARRGHQVTVIAYEWYKREGRAIYSFDFSADDALLAELG